MEKEEYICYYNNIKHVFSSYDEWINCYKEYHHDGDEPSYTFISDGKISVQVWFKYGQYHPRVAGYRL
jgi:hypothetical protein